MLSQPAESTGSSESTLSQSTTTSQATHLLALWFFSDSSTRPHPSHPLLGLWISDSLIYLLQCFPRCGVKFEMAFCFGICALSKAILLWCSRALWVSIPNRPHSAASVFGTCPSRVAAVNGICPAVDGRSPRGRSAQPDGPAPPCTLQ